MISEFSGRKFSPICEKDRDQAVGRFFENFFVVRPASKIHFAVVENCVNRPSGATCRRGQTARFDLVDEVAGSDAVGPDEEQIRFCRFLQSVSVRYRPAADSGRPQSGGETRSLAARKGPRRQHGKVFPPEMGRPEDMKDGIAGAVGQNRLPRLDKALPDARKAREGPPEVAVRFRHVGFQTEEEEPLRISFSDRVLSRVPEKGGDMVDGGHGRLRADEFAGEFAEFSKTGVRGEGAVVLKKHPAGVEGF